MRDYRSRLGVPGFAAIIRVPNENTIPRGSLGPILARAQLVEGDITQDGEQSRRGNLNAYELVFQSISCSNF